MEASLSSPVAAPSAWPRQEACGRCGHTILRARHVHQGQPFKLDPIELFPEGPCGQCHGKGRKTMRLNATGGQGRNADNTIGAYEGKLGGHTWVDCIACGGTGKRGEPVPLHVVAVNHLGIGRALRHGNERHNGEALHRRHRCP